LERDWRFDEYVPLIVKRAARFLEHLIDAEVPRSDYPDDEKLRTFIANADTLPAHTKGCLGGELFSGTESVKPQGIDGAPDASPESRSQSFLPDQK
jgi:hypothetical protein